MKEQIDYVVLKDIVVKMKGGEESARGKFYDLTHKAIYRFCFFLCKNSNSAHDLCHDTFVKAFVNVKAIKDEALAMAWLFQIARNTFLDDRKKKKEESLEHDEVEEGTITSDLESILTVKRILDTMQPEDRMLLILVDLEGMSYKEAAQAMETTEDTIRMKLHKIRKEFTEKFEGPETK